MAVSVAQVWQKVPFQIDAGQTKAIDSCLFSTLQHLEYTLNFNNQTNTDKKSINMSVQKADTDVIETVNSHLGELSVSVTPKVSGANYELEITNNEAFGIDGSFLRAIL